MPLLALLLSACYSEPAPGLLCADDGRCPDGQVCTAGHCLLPGQGGPDGAAAPDLSPQCIPSLSGIGAADFSIAFTIKTKAADESTVIYQRATCDAARNFWNVLLQKTGVLTVELNEADSGQYTTFSTMAAVNDNHPHPIEVRRTALVLVARIDGAASGSAVAPQHIGVLSPLGVATGDPCEAGGLHPLDGMVTGVCLSAR